MIKVIYKLIFLLVCLDFLYLTTSAYLTQSNFNTRKNSVYTTFVSVNSASGVLINKRYILTAAHVVDSEKDLEIDYPIFNNGKVGSLYSLKGKVVEKNNTIDYAIIEIEEDFPYAEVSTNIPTLDNVIAVGRPRGLFWISEGLVTTKHQMISHSAPVYMGSSGGPLYDSKYRLIGINVSYLSMPISSERIPVGFMSGAVSIESIVKDLGTKTSKYFGVLYE